ncbi:MAG TPA: transglycosylase domain-containing protein, partial [Candidatus Limnocylindria bacterium]|nr:transglycosylase domain-containing protein [Candidatus Limnocylindria bacterium]
MRIQPLPAVIFAVFGVLAGGMVLAAVLLYSSYASSLPDVTVLEEYAPDEGSMVVSADERELATFAETNRRVVDYEQIPTVIVDATVAAEDHTYWENPCVDPRAIVRAMLQNVSAGEVVSGASTICQQLVRSVLLPPDLMADPTRQLERKIKEAMLALELDAAYPGLEGKEQIMEFFLNEMYYGNNGYGIWAAVDRYFGKDFLLVTGTPTDPGASPGPSVAPTPVPTPSPSPGASPAPEPPPDPNVVTPAEAALLAGLLRAPSELDPTQYAIPATDDAGQPIANLLEVPPDAQPILIRNDVLNDMVELDYLAELDRNAILDEPVYVIVPEVPRYLAPHFVYATRREVAELLGSEDIIDRGGLTIETTLQYEGYQVSAEKWAQVVYDLDRLTDAELAARYGTNAMNWINQLQGRNIGNDAIVSLNYRTGAVVAYVGSANFYGEVTPIHQPQYDVVGQAFRQSGSAFKPITYATGFETGAITPATMFMDVETEIVPGYAVHNADNRERGPVRARDALKYSLNIPVTKAQQLIGTEQVVDQAERLGLEWDPNQDPNVASLTLGTIGVRMIDLAASYGALANGGVYHAPYLVERILDRDGNVIYDRATDGPEPVQAISAQAAYLTTDILADNTDPAQNSLWGPRFQLLTDAGRRPATLKTGTTTDFRDLQAFGFLAADADPEIDEGAIMTGVWVGNSDFSSIDSVFAADGPTFIWHDYMAEVTALNALPIRDFVRPDGISEREVDVITGQAPGEHTTRTMTELFMANGPSLDSDDSHVELAIEAATGRIWQEGCGDFVPATPEPPTGPQPSGEPEPPLAPLLSVFLDLVGWDEPNQVWEASNRAWIDTWRGRESSVPRGPLGALDAPLAPTEECTPGEIPTSTPTPEATPTP